MTKRFLLASVCLALAACSSSPAAAPKTPTLEENLANPLFADQYWTERTERMVTLHLQQSPILKDAKKAAIVERVRSESVERQKESSTIKNRNPYGAFVSVGEQTQGDALLVDGMLYLGPLFGTYPGVDLHLYLSETVDPRDVAFPDASAVDLGKLQSPYGPQAYGIDRAPETLAKMRTLVIWDAALGRLIAFAQLQTAYVIPLPVLPTSSATTSSAS